MNSNPLKMTNLPIVAATLSFSFAISLAINLTPQKSFAWGSLGHKVTGQVAENMLLPKVKQRVREVLDGQTLPAVTNWADSLKQFPEWKFAVWYHFEKIVDNGDYLETLNGYTQDRRRLGGIVTVILESEKVYLNPNSTKEEKQVALKFLTHFIGDIHQPLHTGRPDDNGGNKISKDWNGQQVTLHSVWDTFLLLQGHPNFIQDQSASTEIPYANYLMQKFQNLPVDQVHIDDTNAWLEESLNLRNAVYQYKDEDEAKYTARFIDSVDERLYLSGLRMANFINNMIAKEQQPKVRVSLRSAIESIAGSISDFISLKPRKVAGDLDLAN